MGNQLRRQASKANYANLVYEYSAKEETRVAQHGRVRRHEEKKPAVVTLPHGLRKPCAVVIEARYARAADGVMLRAGQLRCVVADVFASVLIHEVIVLIVVVAPPSFRCQRARFHGACHEERSNAPGHAQRRGQLVVSGYDGVGDVGVRFEHGEAVAADDECEVSRSKVAQ